MNIKILKKELKKQTDKHPEKFFPVAVLKEKGFQRARCKCGRYFWSQNKESLCGDCEGYQFIGKKITKTKLDFIAAHKAFQNTFKKLGYEPIKRYPVVARWRSDIDFVHATINNFQPYVVSGDVKPPANPLTQIQPSLRFNDVDNIGITGRHFCLHFHAEQFTVQKSAEFNQEQYFRDLHYWLTKGLKLPEYELKYHEDAWGGGGNLGTSLEHFCRGLELGNQVYMNYRTTKVDYVPLANRVLDMGAGLERYAWISSGNPSCYEVAMPTVCNHLYKKTGIKINKAIFSKFMPHSGALNVDESSDIDKSWQAVAKKIKVPVNKLRSVVQPLAALYSIADHSRALLFALADGAIPSNTGGGYNLRSIYRRAYDFAQEYGWQIDFIRLCELHAKYLKLLCPELTKSLKEVSEILKVEDQKYKETLAKSRGIIKSLKLPLAETKLLELYDSRGITPEVLKREKVIKKVPADFYMKVSERHEKKLAEKIEAQREVPGIPRTIPLYLADEYTKEFEARVLKIIDGRFVVLNETLFYPTAGGQGSDSGTLNQQEVVSVEKWGKHIIHEVENPEFKEGDIVIGLIDWDRRYQLMKNHTATHLINGSALRVLGKHIWQAGSEVKLNKARLDITHFASLDSKQIAQIEKIANETIKKKIKVDKQILPKDKAEKLYGFRLYQGGAVPGAELRVVSILGSDTEACGGTHVNNTREVQLIKILGTKKIQDGVIRLIFTAGDKAKQFVSERKKLYSDCLKIAGAKRTGDSALDKAAEVFSVQPKQLLSTLERFIKEVRVQRAKLGLKDVSFKNKSLDKAAEELFSMWKKQKKQLKKIKS